MTTWIRCKKMWNGDHLLERLMAILLVLTLLVILLIGLLHTLRIQWSEKFLKICGGDHYIKKRCMIHKSFYISRFVDRSYYIEQITSTVSKYTCLENVWRYELRSNSTEWGVRETVNLFNFYKIIYFTY